jgi:hypothetical protein
VQFGRIALSQKRIRYNPLHGQSGIYGNITHPCGAFFLWSPNFTELPAQNAGKAPKGARAFVKNELDASSFSVITLQKDDGK